MAVHVACIDRIRVTALTARATLLLAMASAVLLVGQVGRELLPPDDLREAEVAREMLVDGDHAVPHLAGLPFVEKPPGFPAVVAAAYRIAGGPSANAARLVATGFALASLCAVFLLGRRVAGVEAGCLAAALLATSSRFCRTAHEILLDNALTAACAFALLFAWIALEANEIRAKRAAYAGMAFSLGVAFIFKGFVGPALLAAGFLLHVAVRRRWSELRHALRPLPILAFLAPALAWFVPFLARAPTRLIHEFLVENHVGRAVWDYGGSNAQPFGFYLFDLFGAFAPASILLPFAAVSAWRARREPAGAAGLFFLLVGLGSFTILWFSVAKASVYLLPAYPSFALLVAVWSARALERRGRWTRFVVTAIAIASAIVAAGAVGATARLGGGVVSIAGASLVAASAILATWSALKRRDLNSSVTGALAMISLAWMLFFTGPLAQREIDERSCRPQIEQALSIVGDRELLLYKPSDSLRGGCSFYRNRTAREVESPDELVERLRRHSDTVALVVDSIGKGMPKGLLDSARGAGVVFREQGRVPDGDHRILVLVTAGVPGAERP